MVNKFVLDLGNKKQTQFIQLRTNEDEKKFLDNVTNKLNSASPYLKFSVSDIIRLAFADFGQRILGSEFKIIIDIPAKDISFKLKKQKSVDKK